MEVRCVQGDFNFVYSLFERIRGNGFVRIDGNVCCVEFSNFISMDFDGFFIVMLVVIGLSILMVMLVVEIGFLDLLLLGRSFSLY